MRSIWNGTISFGMVNIPIKIYPAVKSNFLSFHFLHEKDNGRIKNQRVCQECGQTVEYDELVRGYEYEKGKYLSLTEDELAKLSIEASKNIPILDFVDPEEIDPIYFDKPYYLGPGEEGDKLYALLRDALNRTNRVGIAKVVLRDREHLAAIKPMGRVLILDLLHFADEISATKGLKLPAADAKLAAREVEMAERLIENMSSRFDPERYKDTYRADLAAVIEKKLEGKTIRAKAKAVEPTTVVDIMSKLKASIARTEGKHRKRRAA